MADAGKPDDNERALAEYLSRPAVESSREHVPAALPEFMTTEEAAILLRVNIGTLRDVIKRSSPPWAKPIGHQMRISRTALYEWFKQNGGAPKKRRAL